MAGFLFEELIMAGRLPDGSNPATGVKEEERCDKVSIGQGTIKLPCRQGSF